MIVAPGPGGSDSLLTLSLHSWASPILTTTHDPDSKLVEGADRPAEPPFVWRCHECQRREAFGEPDLNRFLCDGWPVCCGAAALIFLSALEPGQKAPPLPSHPGA